MKPVSMLLYRDPTDHKRFELHAFIGNDGAGDFLAHGDTPAEALEDAARKMRLKEDVEELTS